MVSGSTLGIASANSSSTRRVFAVVLLTSNSKIWSTPRRKEDERSEQRAQQGADKDLAKNVPAQKPKHRIVPYFAMSGADTIGSFGISLFPRMEFEVIDQNRRGLRRRFPP